jgi:hypothetical protein
VNAIGVSERPRVNAEELIAQLNQQEQQFQEPPQDYHIQFAMLFQKLENAEQKIRELGEKCGRLQ